MASSHSGHSWLRPVRRALLWPCILLKSLKHASRKPPRPLSPRTTQPALWTMASECHVSQLGPGRVPRLRCQCAARCWPSGWCVGPLLGSSQGGSTRRLYRTRDTRLLSVWRPSRGRNSCSRGCVLLLTELQTQGSAMAAPPASRVSPTRSW